MLLNALFEAAKVARLVIVRMHVIDIRVVQANAAIWIDRGLAYSDDDGLPQGEGVIRRSTEWLPQCGCQV